MALDDVWRRFDDHFGVFWKANFDRVPAGPGVYAWFYPLRITSHELEDFQREVMSVFLFDANEGGVPRYKTDLRFGWDKLEIDLERRSGTIPVSENQTAAWERACSSQDSFDELRRQVLSASILLPPLYVGKTRNLQIRCRHHIDGSESEDFHSRYESHARSVLARAKQVSDLLFVAVRTRAPAAEEDSDLEGLIEGLLNRAARPAYGRR